jgi:DNA segregation ATPase FtsK/SpoIIIE-like protein
MAKGNNRAAVGFNLPSEFNSPDGSDQRRIGQIVISLVLTGLAAGYIHWLVPEQIVLAAQIVLWSGVVYIVVRLILALIVAVNHAQARIRIYNEQYSQQRLLTESQRIENKKAEREANMVITVTHASDQVYLTEVEPTSITRPLHLAPSRINGVEVEPSPEETQRWAAYQLLHGSSRRQAAPEPAPAHLPALAPGQIELPTLVRLVDLLPADLRGDMHQLVLGLRLNDAGQLERLTISLHDLFHTIVAASSGWGKSVFVASILTQLATCPDPVKFILIDQQEHGLAAFKQCDRLRYPLLRQPGEILSALREVYDEATRYRADLFARCDADNLAEYNQLAEEPLPPVIVAVDEAATLLTGDKEISTELKRQAWELRKFGIYQVLCLTSAKGTTIDTDHRQQFSSKVQLHANDKYQARLLMDALEATTFPPGRAVIELPKQQPAVVQTPYIDKREVRSLLRPAPTPPPAPEVTPSAQERRVLKLAADGWSHGAICQEVWGYKSSKLYPQIDEILRKFGAVHRAPGGHEG